MLFLKSDDYVGHENSLSILSRDPQLDYPEHSHDFCELILVNSGVGSHIVNDDFSVMLPNTIACVSDKDYHLFNDCRDLSLINVAYKKASVSIGSHAFDVIKKLEQDQNSFIILENDFNQLHDIALKIEEEQTRKDVHSEIMASLLFEQLLLSIDRLSLKAFDNSPVMQAVIYLCNNYYNQDLSVNHVCEIFKVSPKVLSNKIVQLSGLSTNRFINRLRIHRAIPMLRSGRAITEVAFSVGYNDSNYFSTKFKTVTGSSPREFINTNC